MTALPAGRGYARNDARHGGGKSVTLIYPPKGRAGEYAALALNHYHGCDHACAYCYVPNVLRERPEEFHQPRLREDRQRFLAKLEREADRFMATVGKRSPQVLLCFSTDPYCQFDAEQRLTRDVIQVLHRYGIPVNVLTKGGMRAHRDIDLFTEQDAFGSTLTCLSDAESHQWEPGAALPADRLAALRLFHAAGIPTWVSLEPVINPIDVFQLIEKSYPFVDTWKVGTLNYHPRASKIDWAEFGREVKQRLDAVGACYIFKADLLAKLDEETLLSYCNREVQPCPR